MEEAVAHKRKLLKTPLHKIPIGEAYKSGDGHYGIRIKKPKGQEYEDLPLDRLLSMVVSEADSQYDNKQVPQAEGAAVEENS